ncbi:MAG: ATP-binding protein [Candidatus Aminicenantales bacterium]
MERVPRRERRPSVFLILVITILAAGIILAGYSYYGNYAKNYRKAVEQQLAAIADLKVGELAQWRKERLGDAAVFYGNEAFSALVRRYFEKPRDMEASEQLRSWLWQFQEQLRYDRVFLLDAQGVERMAVPDIPEPVAAHLTKDAPEIIRSGRMSFLDFHRDAPDRPIHLSILVPILGGGADRRGLGILVLRINPRTHLYPLISRWPTPSPTAETLLVRRERDDVVYLNELKFRKNVALNLRVPLDKKDRPAVKAVLGQEGIVEAKDYRGVAVLAALHAVPDTPWFLIARIDRAEVHRPLRERLWLTVIIVGSLLLGASTAVGFIWRQQSIRSYKKILEAEEPLSIQRKISNILVMLSDDEWYNEVLKIILQLMQSPFGVFGYIAEDGALVVPTMTRQIWDRCQVPDKTFTFPRNAWSDSSWPRAIREKRIIYSNKVSTQIPEGHVDIQRHISLPILFQREVIGLFQVANKETDYTEADVRLLKSLAEPIAPILSARVWRNRAAEALRESEEAFRALAENANDGILIAVGQGTYAYANKRASEITGFGAAEVLKTGIRDLIHPDEVKKVMERYKKRLAGEPAPPRYETIIIRQDGKSVPIELSASKTVWHGQPADLFIFRDITERREAEANLDKTISELARSNKELEQFAYIASHDLQEPLRMVASFTQLLAERYKDQLDEKAKKYIDYAVDGAVRMQRLINDLLTYSRVGTRGKPPEPADSNSVLGEAIKNLAAMIEENRAVITNDELPTVLADASQLVQVFQNLLANSIKFRGKDNPRIHVSAQDHGREWIFSIRDNGIGIDPQYADRVFLIFQRLHTKEEYPGTGIGLAICRRIVERHGGKIWFESKPGKGSTFFFTLPK